MRNWSDIARTFKAQQGEISEQRKRIEEMVDGLRDWLATDDHAAIGRLLRTAEDLAAEVIRLMQKLGLSRTPRFVLDEETEQMIRANVGETDVMGAPSAATLKLLGEIDRLREELMATAERTEDVLDLGEEQAAPEVDLSEIQDAIDRATPGPFTVRSHGKGIELTASDGKRVARFVNGIGIGDLTLFGNARGWLQALVTEVREQHCVGAVAAARRIEARMASENEKLKDLLGIAFDHAEGSLRDVALIAEIETALGRQKGSTNER